MFSTLLGSLILIVLGAIVYVAYFHPPEEKFTEFYILGLEAKAENYPRQMTVGEVGKVLVGIVNYESQQTSYRVVVTIGGEMAAEAGPIVLEPDKKWEQPIAFTPTRAGLQQKAEFLLYQGDSDKPSNSLYILIDVKGK